jgi:plasmid stabilization system protein ParE
MAAKSVEFLDAASSEYEAAFDWYFTRSEASASNFAGELAQAVSMIAEAPHRWPAGPHGTRKFLLHRFPFAVYYRELPSAIQVVAVAHGHRRPGYWKTRI